MRNVTFEDDNDKESNLKNWKWIAGGVLLLLVVSAAGYWGFKQYRISKETSFACIATSFPYVIMEHKRSELSGFLDNLQIKDGEDPEPQEVDKALADQKAKPKIFFLSEEIDTKMLDLAEAIQSKGPGSMEPEAMTQALTDLEPLFKNQASPYLTECKDLFGQIVDDCGEFENSLEDGQACREKYDDRVTSLLKKHLSGL